MPPPTGRYCFGTSPPKRSPRPAAATSAYTEAMGDATAQPAESPAPSKTIKREYCAAAKNPLASAQFLSIWIVCANYEHLDWNIVSRRSGDSRTDVRGDRSALPPPGQADGRRPRRIRNDRERRDDPPDAAIDDDDRERRR